MTVLTSLPVELANLHNAPELPFTHRRERHVCRVEARPKIDADHLIPFLPAHQHQRTVTYDAAIVYQDINRAFIGYDFIDASLISVIISDI